MWQIDTLGMCRGGGGGGEVRNLHFKATPLRSRRGKGQVGNLINAEYGAIALD